MHDCRNMSVSIIVPTIDSGGAEKQAVLLAVTLSRKYIVNLIVLSGIHSEYKLNTVLLNNSTVSVYKLKGSTFKKLCNIVSIFKKTNTTIIFNYLTLPDIIGSICGKVCGARVYNGIRSTVLGKEKEIFEKIVHNLIASGTIFNSYSAKEVFCRKGFSFNKSLVIPNCYPNIEDYIQRKEEPLKTIITVGRFDPSKDYCTLLKSISLLDRSDYRLCIVGYGVLENQIRDWVKEYGIEDKTDIHIKPDNVSELERNADIYLSTSLYEGTSNSIMEALNWSLPVVATDVGDNNHLVINGENGFLHPIGDVSGLAESLCRLLDSVDLRNKMGLKSNQILRENYSMEIFEKRYIDLIEQRI